MPNPLFQNRTSPNGATAPSNAVNDAHKRYSRSHNTFDFSRVFYNTCRYADITPFDVVEGVEGDVLPFASNHVIRTHTLRSPLMSDVYMKKSYFMVDMKAILPINWDKIFTNPTFGDDVPDDAYCYIPDFMSLVQQFVTSLIGRIEDEEFTCTRLFKSLLFLESVLSNGSLFSSLGYHFSPCVYSLSNGYRSSFDSAFDKMFDRLIGIDSRFRISLSDGRVFYVSDDGVDLNWRQALDIMRHNDFNIYYLDPDDSGQIISSDDLSIIFDFVSSLNFVSFDEPAIPLNLSRVAAYQLIVSQFYTNDSVDPIFSSKLFLENMKMLATRSSSSDVSWPRFSYNGVSTDYDVLSGRSVRSVLMFMITTSNVYWSTDSDQLDFCFAFFSNLFGYRSSLRYGDYFTGAKPRPLAVGDVTADVASDGVSAIDMTRSIMMQRFLNAVNRVGRRFSDYLSGVMDGVAPPDPHEPRFLVSVTSRVTGFEVENTTNVNQGNIVTVMKSGDSNYMYEVEVGSPCVIIGVTTFETPRVYTRTIDRFNWHSNRFEWFNKFMQYIGDQEIYRAERDAAIDSTLPYAYTLRHMEYKQRFPIASGGFVENLPGYAFLTDNSEAANSDPETSNYNTIDPSYIRSMNSEFDRFYSSLTGFSLGSYFHFICKFENTLHARRQMEYSPSIL